MTPEFMKVISQRAQSGSGVCLYLKEVTSALQPWASKGPQWGCKNIVQDLQTRAQNKEEICNLAPDVPI